MGCARFSFQDAELAYLRSMRFIKGDFVDFWGFSGSTKSTSRSPPCHQARSTSPSRAVAAHHPVRDRIAYIVSRCTFMIPAQRRISSRPATFRQRQVAYASCVRTICENSRSPTMAPCRPLFKAWHEEVLRT